MKLRAGLFFLIAFSVLLAACAPGQSAESAIQTGIAQTLQISQLETAAAGGGQQPAATTAPDQAAATSADTATITSTPTPSIPFVSVTADTNCRRGPNVSYGAVTLVTIGQQVEVLKVSSFNDYVVVRNPNGSGDCWLWLRYATTSDFSAFNLPVATVPPTPTPTFTPTPAYQWEGNWNLWLAGASAGTTNVNQPGNSLTGSFTYGGDSWTYSLSLSASQQSASGTATNTSGPTDYPIYWQIKSGNPNQFVGYVDDGGVRYEFCGWRSGSSMPSPCLP